MFHGWMRYLQMLCLILYRVFMVTSMFIYISHEIINGFSAISLRIEMKDQIKVDDIFSWYVDNISERTGIRS